MEIGCSERKVLVKKRFYLILSFSALTFSLLACETTPAVVDPIPYSVAESFKQPGMEGNFEAQAVRASGIVDDLERDDYPLAIFLTGEDNLKAYVKAQGLSEDAFLKSPKLAAFYKSQLVYAKVDIVALRSGPIGTSETFKSAAGTDITITKVRDDPDGVEVRNGEVNGIPTSLGCAGENEFGMICYADAPIVKDFVW